MYRTLNYKAGFPLSFQALLFKATMEALLEDLEDDVDECDDFF